MVTRNGRAGGRGRAKARSVAPAIPIAKREALPRREPRVYRVYVIELAETSGTRARPDLPNLYVGQTADTPEERFAEHRRGHRASRHVRKHGVRLRPDLYQTLPLQATREQAEILEARVADELRQRGHRVFGGH